jgi:hypothetical protein
MYKTKRKNRNNRTQHTYKKKHPFSEYLKNYFSNEENNYLNEENNNLNEENNNLNEKNKPPVFKPNEENNNLNEKNKPPAFKLYSKSNENQYLQSLLSNREYSKTPNRIENHPLVTLDEYTIVLFINMHGAYFENTCINFEDDIYDSLNFFQKISIGQLGCVNIGDTEKKKLFIHMIKKELNKTDINFDFFDLFRKTYKTWVRKSPKNRYNTIQFIKKKENSTSLISHDHHVSYLYDKQQLPLNKPLPLLDKTFGTKQEDIDISNKHELEIKQKYCYNYFLKFQENVSVLINKPEYTNKIASLSESKKQYLKIMLYVFNQEQLSISEILEEDVNSNNIIENITNLQLLLLLNKYIMIIDKYVSSVLRPGIIILYDGWKIKQELNYEKEDIYSIPNYNYLPIKENTFEEEKNMVTRIYLSDLIKMLTNSGYTKIIINDMSCNSFMIDANNLCGTVF